MRAAVDLISGKVNHMEGDSWAIFARHETRRVVKGGHIHCGRGGVAPPTSFHKLVEQSRLPYALLAHQDQLDVAIRGAASKLAAEVGQDVSGA